ncbi:hypothetical protein AVEN_78137-1 [Araneus ventricosus]|uniref:EGF-like domain-containing protein n=1 Tax=Araneus ventricosus TaxID=182803 RepID=A0A4Y2D525_ARAVE|nr:hypothetical protein AVEN_78137-1 [Araneus ventricosus]
MRQVVRKKLSYAILREWCSKRFARKCFRGQPMENEMTTFPKPSFLSGNISARIGIKPLFLMKIPSLLLTDINECSEHPCTGQNTICVNTPGSYDCKCKDGYYPTSPTSGLYYNPKYATCNKEETQWRSASIALGVILSIGIIGVGSYVFYRRKGYWR